MGKTMILIEYVLRCLLVEVAHGCHDIHPLAAMETIENQVVQKMLGKQSDCQIG